ncbi:glycosyl hydrolase family 28-related protein [Bacillus sp. FJAT-27251]|uniref:glycosyl hydrolase family 28-related protein n=1 Tax=Bacillus sp. FJAT-27251 TaxID=1684142 RepID=UPI0006A7D633|nr:glycosyl hydrolase family 28-related protein [Bacillus sp. FJAT-27251]
MLYLDHRHDPGRNSQLIEKYSYKKVNIEEALMETDKIFMEMLNNPAPLPIHTPSPSLTDMIKKTGARVASVFLSRASRKVRHGKTVINHAGKACPDWKSRLDDEYRNLEQEIEREVNVADFGAVGDGLTDNTEAFKKAIGKGRVKVYVPEGHYVTKGIRLPSWTIFSGSGKGKTVIKLSDKAAKGMRLVTNSHHWRGNHHIAVREMSLDWNVERLGETRKTSTWGNHSSCLAYANVTYGWVTNVEGINPGLHCFDITSTFYDYSGDGHRARRGSEYVWIDQCTGYGFGDDGITTHHSDNIFISNCHMCDPSGRAHQKGFSNSNGIEVDDGSSNVWLVNNSTSRCFGGVEIKAHHNSSAGNNVQIIGHLSVHDNRSYNFRHIGHHKNTEPDSKTAYNIRATNLVSIAPRYTELYEGSPPRGMVVSAYRNVVVNHFTLIGDPYYDYKGQPVIAIQYKARNVCINQVAIRDFHQAGTDIKIYGGKQHPDYVQLNNITIEDSASKAIDIGKGAKHVSLLNLKAYSRKGKYGVKAADSPEMLESLTVNGYETPLIIGSRPKKINKL